MYGADSGSYQVNEMSQFPSQLPGKFYQNYSFEFDKYKLSIVSELINFPFVLYHFD